MFKKIKIRNSLLRASALLVLIVFTSVCFSVFNADADNVSNYDQLKEQQVLQTSKSLKNAIEDNQRLYKRNQELEGELQRLKSSPTMQLAKNSSVSGDSVKKSSRPAAMQLASVTTEEVKRRENKTLDLLSRIDAFAEEDERLRADAAKAHYNMGNIYFQKGEYEVAAREYYQAVTLMPDDPDSHFNLAFVSDEFLKDYKTALKHYQIYLYLNPSAKDSPFVKEKLLHIKLLFDSKVDSKLENRQK